MTRLLIAQEQLVEGLQRLLITIRDAVESGNARARSITKENGWRNEPTLVAMIVRAEIERVLSEQAKELEIEIYVKNLIGLELLINNQSVRIRKKYRKGAVPDLGQPFERQLELFPGSSYTADGIGKYLVIDWQIDSAGSARIGLYEPMRNGSFFRDDQPLWRLDVMFNDMNVIFTPDDGDIDVKLKSDDGNDGEQYVGSAS